MLRSAGRRLTPTLWGSNSASEPLLLSHADHELRRDRSHPAAEPLSGRKSRSTALQFAALALVGILLHLLGRHNRAAAGSGKGSLHYAGSSAPLGYVAEDLHLVEANLQSLLSRKRGSLTRVSDNALSLSAHLCQEGRPVPQLAVGVSARAGQVGKLRLLLDALKHPGVAVLVHLDKRAPPEEHLHLHMMIDQLRLRKSGFSSIEVMTPAVAVSKGGISELDVNLRLVEAFVREVCGWRYYVNLSAEDFPLVSPQQLMALLASAPPGSNFIDVNHKAAFGTVLSRTTHVVMDESVYRHDSPLQTNHTSPFRRRYPDLFTPFHGEAWHVLSRDFCEYAAASTDGFPRRLFAYYVNVPSSAEGYFQTLLCASEYSDTLVNDFLRTPSSSPVTERHLKDLRSSGALFARPILNTTVAKLLKRELNKAAAREPHRPSPQTDGAASSATSAASAAAPEAPQRRLAAALRRPRGCASVARHPKESFVSDLNAYSDDKRPMWP